MLSAQQATVLQRCRAHVIELLDHYKLAGLDRSDLKCDLRFLDCWLGIDACDVQRVDDVFRALWNLGGKAHLSRICPEYERIRKIAGRSVTENLDANVRDTLETYSSDSDKYLSSRDDLFCMPEGKGAGVWALRLMP